MDGAHQVRGGKRRRAIGLQRIIGVIDRCSKPVIPGKYEELGAFGDGFRGEDWSLAGHPFVGQKHPSGRSRITVGLGEENGMAQGRLILLAAHEPNGGGGAFQDPPGTPAASPAPPGRNEIIKRFQGYAGGECCAEVTRLPAVRQGPAGQDGGSREKRSGRERYSTSVFIPYNCINRTSCLFHIIMDKLALSLVMLIMKK